MPARGEGWEEAMGVDSGWWMWGLRPPDPQVRRLISRVLMRSRCSSAGDGVEVGGWRRDVSELGVAS